MQEMQIIQYSMKLLKNPGKVVKHFGNALICIGQFPQIFREMLLEIPENVHKHKKD